ncbi:MAG: glycosyltransferase [Bacteroidota bacterium]
MYTPLVSVIIPAYNASRYIRETLESVIHQTYSNWEIIVVDDGSTDQTKEIVLSLTEADPRIHYYFQKNTGVSVARNTGFNNSKGDIIAFLDADDLWLPENLEKKISLFSTSDSVVAVHSPVQFIDENSKVQNTILSGKTGNCLKNLLLWEGCTVPGPSSILFRRNVIDICGEFDPSLSLSADQDYFIRVAYRFPFHAIDQVLVHYRVHSQNMHKNISLMEHDEIIVYNKAKENSFYHNSFFQRKCFSNMYLVLAGSWWKEGKSKSRSLLFITKAFFVYPPSIFKVIAKIFS